MRRIAALAKLDIPASEEAEFARQLDRIVTYIDQLREFDADLASPPAVDRSQEEAEGESASDLPRAADAKPVLESFLDNAPASLDRFLLVPQIKSGPGAGG